MGKRTDRDLTAAFCRAAKPGVRETPSGLEYCRASYPDGDVRGLELRVTPNGEKSWAFRYRDRITGKQSRVTLGRFDGSVDSPLEVEPGIRRMTLHGARIAARQLRAKVDNGGDPATDLRQAKAQARSQTVNTMTDLADVYFEACESGIYRSGRRRCKATSTLTGERWLWKRYLDRRLGAERPETLTRTGLRAVLRSIYGDAPIQSNRCRALLSQLFNFAISEERLAANPIAHITPLAEERARTRTLDPNEIRAIWTGLQNPSALQLKRGRETVPLTIGRGLCIAIELAMVTLQRRAEISGMMRSELDLEHRLWIIPEDRAKGRAQQLVPLSPRALALIEEALALQASRGKTSKAIFPSPRGVDVSVGAPALSHAMTHLVAALGLIDVTLHDLRRTGATGMAALGVPPFIVSKVLAHKDGGGGAAVTARHYNLYAYADEKRDALLKWSRRLVSITSGTPAEGSAAADDALGRRRAALLAELAELDAASGAIPGAPAASDNGSVASASP